MKYAIITENDESRWNDQTGISYNYPAKYRHVLSVGTKVIYYKSKLKDKKFEDLRLSGEPHYFGVAIIGDSYLDQNVSKKEYYCDILTYQPFDTAVPFKVNGDYIEPIPESKKFNYWRDGVREISRETFEKILDLASTRFDANIEINRHRISQMKFDEVFIRFSRFLFDEFGVEDFIGFSEGYIHKEESYKEKLREESLSLLETRDWKENWIGTGEIVDRMIQTFRRDQNNLVGTRRYFGEDSLPYRKLIQAKQVTTKLVDIERALYQFFKTDVDPQVTFNELMDLIGKQYSVLAFIFYLKDNRQYLPISTTNFENAFKILGCDLRLSRKCSWENYKSYLGVINQVKNALEVSMNRNINLIDAHSYCWMLGYNDRYQNWLTKKAIPSTHIVFKADVISPVNNSSDQWRSTPNDISNPGEIDWEMEYKRKLIRGRRAEEMVLEFERRRLLKAGKEGLSKKVEDYSKKYSIGFDVLSWDEDGTERHIEVKSSSTNTFVLTRNEFNKSESDPYYWIYIVDEHINEVHIKQIKTPCFKNESRFRLVPIGYRVIFSLEKC